MNMEEISPLHPRAESLKIRGKLAEAFKNGIVVPEGIAAHGRGEAFDYLIGEKTTIFAREAIGAAVAELLLAKYPVISVNGNVAALVPNEIVMLAKEVNAKLEVNLFHGSAKRERKIAGKLRKHGASEVLGTDRKFSTKIEEIHSNRRKVDKRGIAIADVVLIPLEDGDRTEALKKLGKKVIAIDLNPLSRTAQAADITILDNIVRALPLMIKTSEKLSKLDKQKLMKITKKFNNKQNLRSTIGLMLNRLEELSA